MRQIGNLSDERQARLFGDFLVANGVRNQVEHDPALGRSWCIWIHDEDQVAPAQSWLEQFRANPTATRFGAGASEAARVREAEAKDLADYQKRVRTRKSLFPSMGGFGVGILTYALIFACLVVAFYSKLGENRDFLRHWFISDPTNPNEGLLPEVFDGEVWRLFSPIFIHFGPIHLLFNMMWLYQLGSMIEARQGSWRLGMVVAGTALFSNFAQYYFSHPAFGGMSGVVYGLAGYIWMHARYHRASGLYIDWPNLRLLLIWMVVCFTGMLGPVANAAHLVGLISGVIFGWISAHLGARKPE